MRAGPRSAIPARRVRLLERLRVAALVLVAIALLLVGYLGAIGRLGLHLHVVVPEKLLRSARLSAGELDDVVRRNGLRTVINLCKHSAPGTADEERRCAEEGLAFVSVPLSPERLPPPAAVLRLIDALEHSEPPVLVHCRHGTDRTGLACVLYLVCVAKRPLEEARDAELSLRRGYVRFGTAAALGEFLDLFERTSGGRDFETWAREVYPAEFRRATSRSAAG